MAKPYLLLPFQWTITVVSYFFASLIAPLSAVGRSTGDDPWREGRLFQWKNVSVNHCHGFACRFAEAVIRAVCAAAQLGDFIYDDEADFRLTHCLVPSLGFGTSSVPGTAGLSTAFRPVNRAGRDCCATSRSPLGTERSQGS